MRRWVRMLAAGALTLLILGGDRTPVAAQQERFPYAGLGDSYSSGLGAGDDGSSCRRSPNAYPQRFAAASPRYALTDFVACSGATIPDVQRLQLTAVAPARLISITIGGNDARFGDIIVDCLRPGSGCRRDFPDEDARIDSLQGPLHDLYAQITANAPATDLDVLTYPQIFRSTRGTCGATWTFTADDVAWFRSEYSHMDRVIRAAAAGLDRVHVVDVENAFAGHEVCTPQPWANGGSWRDPYASFHPNALGHAALAAALGAASRHVD